MNPLYAQTGIDWVGIVVSRHEAAMPDTTGARKTLETLLYDRETVQAFRARVSIAFDGYVNDSREIYEIPEIRRYLFELDAKFPYWFYFLSTDNDCLKMVAFCLCRTQKIASGVAQPNRSDLGTFLMRHFDAVNRLFDRFNLDETVNEQISTLIGDYFDTPLGGGVSEG